MNATTVRAQLVRVLATLALAVFTAPSSARACVVGTGTSATCKEAALNACLPGGGSFDGTVTFNCGASPVTITVNSTETISADTTIDGGSTIALSSSSGAMFYVTAHLTVQNLTITTSAGDGIANGDGTVTATNCTISNNIGNGISNDADGTVTATNCTISGNGGYGISNNSPSGRPVTATNCTISGNIGNGIANNSTGGPVTVTNCTVSSNGGYGIANNSGSGPVTATNCTISGNSGDGIVNNSTSGPVTATNCTISGNSGDGILSNSTSGPVTATNCTVSGNSGDGILSNSASGPVTATNCTVSSNSGDGIANKSSAGGPVTATNCTVSSNGSDGILNDSSSGTDTTITNTIMADNTSANCGGTITDGGHNLQSPGTTCGTTITTADPKLDPTGLRNNGGPTQTIALEAGSPAINAGNESVCAAAPVNNVDERGFVRPGLGATNCSIGAFEFNSSGPPQAVQQAPALSSWGLFTLAALLAATGWLRSRRAEIRKIAGLSLKL